MCRRGDARLAATGLRSDRRVPFAEVDTSRELVAKLASELNLTNVVLLQGIFPEETGHEIEGRRFRFCHIDVASRISTGMR
jgi:hypothetical protein